MPEIQYLIFKEQIIRIWLRHLRFEIKEYYETCNENGYKYLNNELIRKLNYAIEKKDYKEILKLSKEAQQFVKQLTGNHFHIWLFWMLEIISDSNKIIQNLLEDLSQGEIWSLASKCKEIHHKRKQ